MKKTLVAVAVAALVATSANAAVVYNQDGTKVEVGGQFRVLVTKNSGERVDLKNQGSRVHIKATQDLGSGYSALAATELRFSSRDAEGSAKQDFNDIEAHQMYAGFAQEQIGTLTFGRQATNLDDLGISDYTYDLGGVNQTHDFDKKSVKFRSAEWNSFSFGLDYFFGGAKQNTEEEQNGKGWGGALFYTAQVANDTTLTLNGGFSQVRTNERNVPVLNTSVAPIYTTSGLAAYPATINTVDEYKTNAFIVGAELATGPFALAVDYSQSKLTNKVDDDFNKVRALEVGAKYNYLENASVYGEYQYVKSTSYDKSAKERENNFILGTDYWLTKNVVTYVEGGTFQTKDQDSNKARDNKIGVGLRVYF